MNVNLSSHLRSAAFAASVTLALLWFGENGRAQSITFLNPPAPDMEGYHVKIKSLYGESSYIPFYNYSNATDVVWTNLSEAEGCLTSPAESAEVIAYTDIYTSNGVLVATNVLAAPLNGTMWVWRNAELSLGPLFWDPIVSCGQISAYTFTALPDADRDGVLDSQDQCPDSIRTATVVLNGIDTQVSNFLLPSGCTLADAIAAAATGRNHGAAVRHLVHMLNGLKKQHFITGKEIGHILRAFNHRPKGM